MDRFCRACGAALGDGADDGVVVVSLGEPAGGVAADRLVVVDAARPRRTRTVGGAVVLAAVATVGASVATGGDPQRAAVTSPTTAAATVWTATTPTAATTTTTTATPSPATTTTPPPATDAPTTVPVLAPVAPAPVTVGAGPLLGEPTGLTLVVGLSGTVYRLDLDAGVATPLPGAPRVDESGPALTSVGLLRGGALGVTLERPGAPERGLRSPGLDDGSSGPPYQYIGEGPPGRLWFVSFTGATNDVWYVDVADDIADGAAFGSVDPAGVVGADGLGGVLFGAAGGTYARRTPGASERISEGNLVAVNGPAALVAECDAALACRWRVLDRRRGVDWSVAMTLAELTAPTFAVGVAADGHAVARVVANFPDRPNEQDGFVLQIVGPDGELVRVHLPRLVGFQCPPLGCRPYFVWSPDGRWLFAQIEADSFWAWRPGLAEPVVVRLDLEADASISALFQVVETRAAVAS